MSAISVERPGVKNEFVPAEMVEDIPKPRYRCVIPENIPDALKAIPSWIVWRGTFDQSKRKWKKPPFSPRTGLLIHQKKPLEEQIGTFDQALSAYRNGMNVQGEHRTFDGIGIYPGDTLVGIDVDKCVDGQDRILVPDIRGWVDGVNSYVELSPTMTDTGGVPGCGIRCFALGCKPQGAPSKATRDEMSLEMYQNQGTYLTVTGHSIKGKSVVDDQEAIDAFAVLMRPPTIQAQWEKQNSPPVFVSSSDKADEQILDTMFRTAKHGEILKGLYYGGSQGGDHSREDQTLLEALAYYTHDPVRTEQLFRASAMYREKGKGNNYLSRSIAKIFKNKSSFFDWNKTPHSGGANKNGVPGVPSVPVGQKNKNNNVIELSNCGTPPANKSVPGVPEFFVNDKGVYFQRFNAKGKPLDPEWLCSPLKILAQTRSENQDNWGLLIEWEDPDRHQHKWAAPRSALIGDGLDFFRELTDRGLLMALGQKTRSRLTDYLLTTRVEKRVVCTEKTGWHNGGVYVFPDRTIGGTPENQVIFQSEDHAGSPYGASGTLAEWRERVSSLCQGNSRLILAISTAFASVLLKITGDENGGVHIVGSSSTGKTTAGTVAGSVFGGAAMKQTWNATVNGLGATAVMFNDSVMILDELSQCEPKAAGETAYLLSNGIEKGRANRNGGMKARRRWRMMFLSNGEIDLSQHLQADGKKIKAGQGVRLLTVPADAGAGLGLFENLNGYPNGAALADALKANALKYYGTAGPAFIEKVADCPDEVKGQITALRSQFLGENMPAGAESQVGRAAARFALIAIAGELATAYSITGWEKGEAIASTVTCFKDWQRHRGGVGNHEEHAFLEQVREHFERFGESRYAKIPGDGGTVLPRAGFRESTGEDETGAPGAYNYYVLPNVFKNDICSGFDRQQGIEILERLGILVTSSDGKKSVAKRLPGIAKKARCYHIRGERLFDGS